jgi:hypothetical protein
VDVPGILAELNTTDGIISARVGDADLTEPNSKGSVSFKSGTYLNVKIQYMGRVSKLISFSDTPLEGRVFSKTDKTWRFPLQDGVTFAKGGKVATIEDFFKHIGLDFAKYRL